MTGKSKKVEEVLDDESSTLSNHLYEACNILRGPVSADEYKNYLFPLMFLKRISDVYDEETAVALVESGGDEEYAALPEMHRFQIPSGCHWSDLRNISIDVGHGIQDSMRKIELANPETLYGLFSDFDEASWTNKNKLSDSRLKDLIEHFSKLPLGNESVSADVMGQAYEFLIKKFADMTKDSAGEFYTPRAVVRLMISILDPKPGETIYDPACGTGGMLLESMRHINDNNMVLGRLFGQEKNITTASIARINLFLHGANDFKILRGDTLRNPLFKESDNLQKFDCVVANPPFSLEEWGAELWQHDPYGRNIFGTPSDKNGDYAWLQHMVCSMSEDKGRMGVVLPQGVLFKKEFNSIRCNMVRSGMLDTIIQLPANLFYGTQLAPCILILRRNKSNGRIRFVDASTLFKKGRAQNYLLDEHVKRIHDLAVSDNDEEGFCKIVRIDDLDEKTAELNVSKFVTKPFVDDTPPYDEVVRKLESEFQEIRRLESEIESMVKEWMSVE